MKSVNNFLELHADSGGFNIKSDFSLLLLLVMLNIFESSVIFWTDCILLVRGGATGGVSGIPIEELDVDEESLPVGTLPCRFLFNQCFIRSPW